MVSVFTSSPMDYMVQLDDIGIDYAKITEYELFLILFQGLIHDDTSLLFEGLDLSSFVIGENKQNGELVFVDQTSDIVIDRGIYYEVGHVLRHINFFEKDVRKPGNKEARDYLLERARKKMKRQKRLGFNSYLERLIIALVNTEQYKYNYEDTQNLSIYQFNASFRQVSKKINYDNVMHGVYSGIVNTKDLPQESLSWVSEK